MLTDENTFFLYGSSWLVQNAYGAVSLDNVLNPADPAAPPNPHLHPVLDAAQSVLQHHPRIQISLEKAEHVGGARVALGAGGGGGGFRQLGCHQWRCEGARQCL